MKHNSALQFEPAMAQVAAIEAIWVKRVIGHKPMYRP
jgi:hypothetical protein